MSSLGFEYIVNQAVEDIATKKLANVDRTEVIGYFAIKVGTLKVFWMNCKRVVCYLIGNWMSMMSW